MGRFVGEFFSQYTSYELDPGTAALIGGASMLCGISRMTLYASFFQALCADASTFIQIIDCYHFGVNK